MLNIFKSTLCLMLVFLINTEGVDPKSKTIPLNSKEGLELVNVKVEVVTLNGKEGIKVEKPDSAIDINAETLVIIENSEFQNGSIELEIAGEPRSGAGVLARGFVGIAFRIDSTDYSNYECIYLRPLNGRAKNQLQRNHSVQYISHPEYTWQRLRNENPGMYESYVDLLPGEWIKYRIEIADESAKLFVHGNSEPTLIVNDLKHGVRKGLIGLWLHPSTIAYFRNLKITPNNDK